MRQRPGVKEGSGRKARWQLAWLRLSCSFKLALPFSAALCSKSSEDGIVEVLAGGAVLRGTVRISVMGCLFSSTRGVPAAECSSLRTGIFEGVGCRKPRSLGTLGPWSLGSTLSPPMLRSEFSQSESLSLHLRWFPSIDVRGESVKY